MGKIVTDDDTFKIDEYFEKPMLKRRKLINYDPEIHQINAETPKIMLKESSNGEI
jgi:hypothetical protein